MLLTNIFKSINDIETRPNIFVITFGIFFVYPNFNSTTLKKNSYSHVSKMKQGHQRYTYGSVAQSIANEMFTRIIINLAVRTKYCSREIYSNVYA